MTTEDDFQRMLDGNPGDHLTRLVFADWLEEQGDPRAAGYRALATRRKRPAQCTNGPDEAWIYGGTHNWTWYSSDPNAYGDPGHENHLSAAHIDRFTSGRRGSNSTDFGSRQEAEDAAALAWAEE
jgi:uncharacterized protein (TIGR02996 family)